MVHLAMWGGAIVAALTKPQPFRLDIRQVVPMSRSLRAYVVASLRTALLSAAMACGNPEASVVGGALSLSAMIDGPMRIADGFTNPAELVELADSSVIAADRRTTEISRVWPNGERRQLGSLGDGPGEFRSVWHVLQVTPDSLLISPVGEQSPLAVISIEGGVGRSLQRRDFMEVTDPRRERFVELHVYTRADTTGHVYGAATGWYFLPKGGSGYVDSVPLVRLNIRTGRMDTILRFAIGDVPSGTPPIVDNEIRKQLGLGPYRAENDWTVKGDGTVILIDARHYQVMERSVDGKTMWWPKLPELPRRSISDREWSAFLDSSRVQQQRLLAPLGVKFGEGRGSSRLMVTLLDPPRPSSRPPVAREGRRRVMLSPTDLWVPLGDCLGDQRECWDVLSLSTRTRRGTIQLNAGETLLGLSRHFVYVGREDEDDLIAIWRHAYPHSFAGKAVRPTRATTHSERKL
jgi:hypothetical protein